MKSKWLILLICGTIVLGCVTGCQKKEQVNVDHKQEETMNDSIIGTWNLNRNVKVSDSKYSSLKALIGDSYGSDTLEIHKDGTFSLSTGMMYDLKGKYKYQNNELSFYDIKDTNIKEESSLKDIEEHLRLKYIEYNGNRFFQMHLYDLKEFEGYLFYEKEPKEKAGSYADDPVPEIQFQIQNSQDVDTMKSEYIGTYENKEGKTIEIVTGTDGLLYLQSNHKKTPIELNEENETGIQSISNVSQVLENADMIYVYPKGVRFSLSDNPANYEEGETDSSKYRLFVKSNHEASELDVYYKK